MVKDCKICGGDGWCWIFELPHYKSDPYDATVDDTRDPCPCCDNKIKPNGGKWKSKSKPEFQHQKYRFGCYQDEVDHRRILRENPDAVALVIVENKGAVVYVRQEIDDPVCWDGKFYQTQRTIDGWFYLTGEDYPRGVWTKRKARSLAQRYVRMIREQQKEQPRVVVQVESYK